MTSLAEPGPIGVGPIGVGENPGEPSKLYAATEASSGQIYLVQVYPTQLAATRPLLPWGEPIGVNAIGLPPANSISSETVALLYSDGGYVSPPGGEMGSMYFEGRAKQALRMTRSLPVAPESARQVQLEVAGIEIENNDGALDTYLREYTIDGSRIIVKFGMRGYAYEDFASIYDGRALNWRWDFSKLSITARDQSYRLNVVLQQTFYSGAGGVNGTSELAGKPLPLSFGICRNIAPVLIDPSNLVYQFHARAAESIDAVYDRRAALVSDGDVADYAALTGAVISTGHYKTCKALGLFRLGSTPSGLVTADVKGDATGSYINTSGAIMLRMMTDFVQINASEIDTDAFANLDSTQPGIVGWFQGTETIMADEAVSQLARGAGAWWGGTTEGLLTTNRLEEPDPVEVALYLDSWDLIAVSILDPPPGTSPPRFRQRVAYARNWTVQRGEDLAGTVSAADRQAVAEPYSVASAISAEAQADFLTAQDPPVLESFFDQESDAQDEADRLISLHGQQRQTVKIEISYRGLLAGVGTMISIVHPRINAGQRWDARCIAQEVDADRRRANFTLWG